MTFRPCQGKTHCRDDGQQCLTCGRSLAEIAQLRQLLNGLVDMAIASGYRNIDEFAAYLAHKVPKMVAHRMSSTGNVASSAEEVSYRDR